ncbi:MAG: hypothetical protein HC887_12055 [Desulfobacteraceae bacterium]|nr:hypothetical protein [Desulfobacteraceae bacterium]
MRNLWAKLIGLATAIMVLMPELVLAAGEKASAVVIVSDTRRLTGLLGWWGSLYNESHLYFMLLTVVLVPIIGVMFGTLADIIMKWIGLDLTSRELAEH